MDDASLELRRGMPPAETPETARYSLDGIGGIYPGMESNRSLMSKTQLDPESPDVRSRRDKLADKLGGTASEEDGGATIEPEVQTDDQNNLIEDLPKD